MTRLALMLAALPAALLAAPAFAQQDFDAVRLSDSPSEFRARAGGALFSAPAYRGSDERRTVLLPVADFQWGSGWFAGTGNGVGYDFGRGTGLHWGVRGSIDWGRRESRSSALRGMGDIDAHPEAGVFLSTALDRGLPGLQLHASLRAGAGGSGLVGDLGVGWSFDLAPGVRLRASAAATLANSSYMQDFFGVTAAQSATSGYAPYSASGGVRDVRAGGTLIWALDRRLAMAASLTASSLRGDAAQSPLTRDTSGLTAFVGATYAF